MTFVLIHRPTTVVLLLPFNIDTQESCQKALLPLAVPNINPPSLNLSTCQFDTVKTCFHVVLLLRPRIVVVIVVASAHLV